MRLTIFIAVNPFVLGVLRPLDDTTISRHRGAGSVFAFWLGFVALRLMWAEVADSRFDKGLIVSAPNIEPIVFHFSNLLFIFRGFPLAL